MNQEPLFQEIHLAPFTHSTKHLSDLACISVVPDQGAGMWAKAVIDNCTQGNRWFVIAYCLEPASWCLFFKNGAKPPREVFAGLRKDAFREGDVRDEPRAFHFVNLDDERPYPKSDPYREPERWRA